MRNAGKDFSTYIVRDLDGSDYPMGLVRAEGFEDSDWAVDLAESLKIDDVCNEVLAYYGGVFECYKYN